MKNLFIAVVLLFSITSNAQMLEGLDTINDTVKNLSEAEQTIVSYVKDIMPEVKKSVSGVKDIIAESVAVLIEQGTIVVKQYLIFTAITLGLPILLGLFIFFYLRNKLKYLFVTDDLVALAHNNSVTNSTVPDWKKKSKYVNFFNNYFKGPGQIVGYITSTITLYVVSAMLIFPNLLPFIKVTFFSKLYLVELVTKYI